MALRREFQDRADEARAEPTAHQLGRQAVAHVEHALRFHCTGDAGRRAEAAVADELAAVVDRPRERLRLYILDWNGRSRKVAEGHGFAVESVLPSADGRFLVMIR